MIVESRAVQPFLKNGFLVGCDRTREAVLIDPGDEVRSLLELARERRLSIRHILLTHAHVDHVTGVREARRTLGVPVHLHREDLFLYERAADQAAFFGIRCDPLPPVDEFYTAGQVISFGDCAARVWHTPGHCPGGVCLEITETTAPSSADAPPELFVGDTLFAGSIGRTDLPGGDLDTLLRSIGEVLFAFGDDAPVHPGHGPATTIGRERRTNPFLTGLTSSRG